MYNNGCIVALISSVKHIQQNLEKVRGQIDADSYQKIRDELDSMKRFMEGMIDGKPSDLTYKRTSV